MRYTDDPRHVTGDIAIIFPGSEAPTGFSLVSWAKTINRSYNTTVTSQGSRIRLGFAIEKKTVEDDLMAAVIVDELGGRDVTFCFCPVQIVEGQPT